MSDDAMDFFSGRRPSFDSKGKVRGFRSRPGAPQAEPPLGLTTGTNATSAVDWVGRFKTSGQQVQTEAMKELGIAPPSLGVETAPRAAMPDGGSIASRAIDSVFGAGHWGRIVGNPSFGTRPAESINTPAPFMPQPPSRPFLVPGALTSPEGGRATDAANLAANRTMYQPGGLAGAWGRQAAARPATSAWETPGTRGATDIATRYATPENRRYATR